MTPLARQLGLLALVVVASSGCSRDDPPPAELADGAAARPPPVLLEDIDGPIVMSRARVLPRASLKTGTPISRCVSRAADPAAVVVERVGVAGSSVTFSDSRGRELRGCDASSLRKDRATIWCGHAFARLRGGRLRDPRLSLTCRDADGEPLGFVWVQPDASASYVVVRHARYGEAHPVVAELPVRVTTKEVDADTASAALAVSEHRRDGSLIRSYELEARVSG